MRPYEAQFPPTPVQLPRWVALTGSALVAVILLVTGCVGCTNPETPAGYVGYLSRGAVVGSVKFYGLQKGPSSPGLSWMLNVNNVPVLPVTYTEEFTGTSSVMSRDNLQIAFRVHCTLNIRANKVREFVEHYGDVSTRGGWDLVEVAYAHVVREPLRNYARDEIQKWEALQIKDEITPIGERVQERVRQLTDDTPFHVTSVVVGNVQYPPQLADAVTRRLSATQALEQRRVEIETERASAQARVVQAEGIARSMEIINSRLTDQYIQHEAIEAQKAMAGSPNHTVIYIPSGRNGVPLVSTVNP